MPPGRSFPGRGGAGAPSSPKRHRVVTAEPLDPNLPGLKSTEVLRRFPGVNHTERLARMAEMVTWQLRDVMGAYVNGDVDEAREVVEPPTE